MEVIKKLEKIGYKIEPWSSFERHKGYFGVRKVENGFLVGLLNTNNKTIQPCFGYHFGYLKNISKDIGYKLINDCFYF